MTLGELSKKTATSAIEFKGTTVIKYHQTNIVTLEELDNGDRKLSLNTGGWSTVTTKRRMNQALEALNIRGSVYQKNYQWYVQLFDNPAEKMDDTYTTIL